ncbi:hypothetical protein BST27_18715 [Mycobacterium intermedium]|uniref:Beta-lactamase-related domain-containing protein n=1 Tax=Mycobacterium intermedium TaxID=28445 RepID=A0A1E3SEZ2_MYCIE|nr:serine hydrolase [Mycobacterium intermedium]MCV6963050.1 serine hydrolase [Mycobacterium intermedium]ODR00734.1 hypothetical protein BHQ20_11690 [Mycobacterium intermedium]OPE52347.1 hypothetical protein BV508_02665 [Mycobacterium intermedium]ORB00298.1 hypothetical protein BST27_18715 [Mycobacterium intermedium]
MAVSAVLVACGGHPSSTVATTPTTTATATEKARSSQAVLDDAIKADEPGCSAAVGVEGKVVWTGVRGVQNLGTGEKITSDTVFDIASVSKQFTATAILLMVQAGKLTLDDAVSQYVSDLPPWATRVSVGQLMHQTSGIPDYTGLLQEKGFQLGDATTQTQALQAVADVPELAFKPGSRYEYSNSNYLLLGEIVHRVAAQPLADYLAAQIFQPLGLGMVLDPVGRIPNKAMSYTTGGSEREYELANSAWEQVGDGGIQTTPSQLVRWGDNYRTGNVGGPQLLDAQLAGAVETEPGGSDRYGAGIFVLANGMLEHDGSWAGFVSDFRVSGDRRTSVAVSCNADKQDPEAMTEAIGRLWM